MRKVGPLYVIKNKDLHPLSLAGWGRKLYWPIGDDLSGKPLIFLDRLVTINWRFAPFFRPKMNCIPHFGYKNANKVVSIPHFVKVLWPKVKHSLSKRGKHAVQWYKNMHMRAQFFQISWKISEPWVLMRDCSYESTENRPLAPPCGYPASAYSSNEKNQ